MKNHIRKIYLWLVKCFFYFWPDYYSVNILRGWFMGKAFKKCGSRFAVSYNVVFRHTHLISIGNNVSLGCGVEMIGGEITIGNMIGIGPNTVFVAVNHKFNGEHYRSGSIVGKIVVENGAWIGANCTLLAGTHIHKASVVGAGSVCSKDYIHDSYLIAGVPAKPIKKMEPSL